MKSFKNDYLDYNFVAHLLYFLPILTNSFQIIAIHKCVKKSCNLLSQFFMQRGPDPGFPYISPSLGWKSRDLMMLFETPLFFVSFESRVTGCQI